LSSLLPKTWADRQEIDHKVGGQVVHRFEPAPFKPAERLPPPSGDVVDGEFVEVPMPEQQSIETLRAQRDQAREKLRMEFEQPRPAPSERVTRPDRPVQTFGRDTDRPDDKRLPDDPRQGHQPQQAAPHQQPPSAPSYVRRPAQPDPAFSLTRHPARRIK